MDLNTITSASSARDPAARRPVADGYAWLAGGTWLFSEPQPATTAHRSPDASLARLASVGGRPGDRRHLQGR